MLLQLRRLPYMGTFRYLLISDVTTFRLFSDHQILGIFYSQTKLIITFLPKKKRFAAICRRDKVATHFLSLQVIHYRPYNVCVLACR